MLIFCLIVYAAIAIAVMCYSEDMVTGMVCGVLWPAIVAWFIVASVTFGILGLDPITGRRI